MRSSIKTVFFSFALHLTFVGYINADVIYIPGTVDHESAQPYSPWYTVTPEWIDNPSRYIQKRKENEVYEARGALLWIPVINYVTTEAAAAGAIHPDHVNLFSNLLFGVISVETNGLITQTGNFGKSSYQESIGTFRGLSQLVGEKLYLEENPYEPLTAIRTGLRNLAPFIYHSQSIEAALAEHNNGKTTSESARIAVDAFCTIGQEFFMRVINAVWWGHALASNRDFDASALVEKQYTANSVNAAYYQYLPDWQIFHWESEKLAINIPNIPFNWIPPKESLAYRYINQMPGDDIHQKQKNLVSREIETGAWNEDIEYSYPITDNPSTDKSHCNEQLNGKKMVLKSITVPDFIFTERINISDAKISKFDPDLNFHYPQGAYGTKSASENEQHQYYINGSILSDTPGLSRSKVVYNRTRGVSSLCRVLDGCIEFEPIAKMLIK